MKRSKKFITGLGRLGEACFVGDWDASQPLAPAPSLLGGGQISLGERERRFPSWEGQGALGRTEAAMDYPLLGERERVRGKEAREESRAMGLAEAMFPLTPALYLGEREGRLPSREKGTPRGIVGLVAGMAVLFPSSVVRRPSVTCTGMVSLQSAVPPEGASQILKARV